MQGTSKEVIIGAKHCFLKKNLVLFIVKLSVIFFSTLIFSTLNTTLNSTLDTLVLTCHFVAPIGSLTQPVATALKSVEQLP